MNSTKPNHDPKVPALTLSRVIIAAPCPARAAVGDD